MLFYAGAGLNQTTWDDLTQLAIETTGERIIFLSSLGSTETAPLALACTWEFDRAGNIGLPAPGVELKLVPNEGKLEARLRGPNITPGYWRQPELTRAAFDEEGFYKIGDALKFADPDDPLQRPAVRRPHRRGLQAVDRHLGQRRALARALHRPFRALCARRGVRRARPRRHRRAGVSRHRGLPQARRARPPRRRRRISSATPSVRAKFAELLRTLRAMSPGSSTRVARAILMAEPPSMDKGEVTDKGSINQRAVLKNRAALVDELYATPLSARVIAAEGTELMEVKGQAAIVTGGASGLGAACARTLAAAGAKVAVLDVNQKAAAEVAIDINGIAIACDVADSARAPKPRSSRPPPTTGRRASWSIAPASGRPSASSAATGRCRSPTSSASSAST